MSSSLKEHKKNRDHTKSVQRKVISWWKENESKCVFFIALLLSSIVSFEIGILLGREDVQDPLIYERVRQDCPACEQNTQFITPEKSVEGVASSREDDTSRSQCLYVGSVNSDKYHSPSCHWAQRIKPENIRCFQSKEEAEGAGYKEGCIEE